MRNVAVGGLGFDIIVAAERSSQKCCCLVEMQVCYPSAWPECHSSIPESRQMKYSHNKCSDYLF